MGTNNERDKVIPDGQASRSLETWEAALGSLTPRSVQLDRDRLMFLAGKASAGARASDFTTVRWRWPVLCAVTASAASFLIALAIRPAPTVVEKIVYLPAASSQAVAQAGGSESQAMVPITIVERPENVRREPASPTSAAGYLTLRDRVLASGIESWSSGRSSSGSGASSAAYRDLLDRFLTDG